MKDSDILWLGVIVVCGVLAFKYLDVHGGIGGLSVSINTPGQSGDASDTTNNYYTESAAERADLANLFMPVIAASDLATTCQLLGGDYFEQPERVGCFDMSTPINLSRTCDTAAFSVMMMQCRNVGAVGQCDLLNVGCYYD